MKSQRTLFAALGLLCIGILSGQNPSFCGSENPGQQWEDHFQELIKKQMNSQAKGQAVVYTIPVIVHVIHGGEAPGVYPNLAQGQIVSQIQALNTDFGGVGYNSGNYPAGAFTSWAIDAALGQASIDGIGRVKIANTYIQFCLATKDTAGNLLAEPGIDRISYQSKGWTDPGSLNGNTALKNYVDNTIKPQTIWNVNKYFNIWITDSDMWSNNLLGYATFPVYSGLTGIPAGNSGSNVTDGVWCYAMSFGSKTFYPSGSYYSGYDRGRTTTHEVGHWLGLRHIGGDGNNNFQGDCSASDFCDDTPPQKGGFNTGSLGQNFGSPSYPLYATGNSSCPSSVDGSMFMNFMDYTDDQAKYMFSNDQAIRMQTAMANGIYRKNLGTHNLCSISPIASSSGFKVAASVCESAVLTLSNTSSGIPVPSYTWSANGPATFLPDANTANGVSFSTAGTYVITLTTDNGFGAQTSTKTVVVKAAPSLSLSASSGPVCFTQGITVNATGGTSYVWEPGSMPGASLYYDGLNNQTFTCTAITSGCTSSLELAFTVMDCTGIKDLSTNQELFSIYPNPSNGILNVKASAAINEQLEIAVMDVRGKLIRQTTVQFGKDAAEAQIQLNDLSQGLYMLKLTRTDGAAYFTKFVKE